MSNTKWRFSTWQYFCVFCYS